MEEAKNTNYEIAKMTKEEERTLSQLEQSLNSEVDKDYILIAYEKTKESNV